MGEQFYTSISEFKVHSFSQKKSLTEINRARANFLEV